MPTPYEIRRIMKQITSAEAELEHVKSKMRSEVSQTSGWWKGSAAETFRSRYSGTDSDINRLKRDLEDLRSAMNKLANAIEDAEADDDG